MIWFILWYLIGAGSLALAAYIKYRDDGRLEITIGQGFACIVSSILGLILAVIVLVILANYHNFFDIVIFEKEKEN